MSFANYKSVIDEGDTVILYLSNSMHAIHVVPEIKNKKDVLVENVFQTTFGALKVKSLIGQKYGSKVRLSSGWGHVLPPSPELWTLTLPHRTQIIYTPDISTIVMQLELKPGSTVIEAGTGSGSLSHALIRAVKPAGHLYTFDFHEDRAKQAAEEFQRHGLKDYVTVEHRDVCSLGFGSSLDARADAVFLDLPHPWLALPHAMKAIKDTGGRLCTFSPCLEQVQRARLWLQQAGCEARTLELLQTELKVSARSVTHRNLDFLKQKRSGLQPPPSEDVSMVTATAPLSQPGHTGFLTFATVPPKWGRQTPVEDS